MRPNIGELLSDSELPSYFNKLSTGNNIAVLSISYAGTLALITIQNNRLITEVGGPFPIASMDLVKNPADLQNFATLTPSPINLNLDLTAIATMVDLANQINAIDGYTCIVIGNNEDLSPLLLNPVSELNFASAPSGLVIEYAGATAIVTISGGFLTTTVTDPTPFTSVDQIKDMNTMADFATLTPEPIDLNLNLSSFATLDALAQKINSYNDYSCSVTGAGTGLSPSLLTPVSNVNFANSSIDLFLNGVGALSLQAMSALSSLLMVVLNVYTSALQSSIGNVDDGLEETCVATADGPWLDLWGSTLGFIIRNSNESDAAYRNRIIQEVQRIRLNQLAITDTIGSVLLEAITIRDSQHDSVWIIGNNSANVTFPNGPFAQGIQSGRIIIDRPHSQPILYIGPVGNTLRQLEQFAAALPQIMPIIERNRMTGIMVVYGNPPSP